MSEARGPKVEIIIPIPGYGAEQPAYIDFPGKFTELQWAYVMNVLTVMKPGLVMAESADAGQRPSPMPDRPTRIDAFERDLDDLIELLTMVRKSARDLHTLAYDRKVAASERVSASGPMHFYLDQNGDMKAREAMRHLMRAMHGYRRSDGNAVPGAFNAVERAARDCKRILVAGDPPMQNRSVGPRLITAAEHLEAIRARARRVERGEYTPHRVWPQPDPGS